jgi:hypothetical protein
MLCRRQITVLREVRCFPLYITEQTMQRQDGNNETKKMYCESGCGEVWFRILSIGRQAVLLVVWNI